MTLYTKQQIQPYLNFLRWGILDQLHKVTEIDYGEGEALLLEVNGVEFVFLPRESGYQFPISIEPIGRFQLYVMGKMTTKQALNDLDKLGRYVKGNLNTMSDSEIVHEIAHFLDIRKGVFTVEEASNFSEEDGIIETFKNTNVVEINAFLNETNFINDYKGFNTYADVVNTIMNPEYDAVGKEKLLQLTEFKNIIMQFFDFPQSEVFPSVK